MSESKKFGFSPDQVETINKWLESNWKNKNCPICNHSNWSLNNGLFELRNFNFGSINLGGPVQPLVTLMCDKCGYTHSFNAIKVGAIQKPDKESPSQNIS